jgi:hypothetical protein
MKSGALSRVLQVKDSVGAAPESQTQLSRGRYTWYAFSQQRGMCYVYATELDYNIMILWTTQSSCHFVRVTTRDFDVLTRQNASHLEQL